MIDFDQRAVAGVRGLRAYAPGRDMVDLRRRFADQGLVELGANESPYGPSPAALRAAMQTLPQAHRYPDPRGHALKQALAQRLGADADNLLLGNGSNEVLVLLAQAFAGAGDEVIASQYGFAVYAIAAQAVGATLRQAPALPTDHAMARGHDLNALLAMIGPRTKLVFLANPNNPTGTWFDAEAFAAFIGRVPKDVIVVVDEAYAEFVDVPDWASAIALLPQHPNLVVARTFSKAYGLAGLRLGYAIAHVGLIAVLDRLRQTFNVNAPALAAAEAALADTTHLRAVIEGNALQRERLSAALQAWSLPVGPSQTNFLLVEFGSRAAEVETALAQRGVTVCPMAGYGLPACLRISVGTETDNARLLIALGAIFG